MILRGEDWFLCFDDDEPPEIVITRARARTNRSAEICKARAAEILNGLKIQWRFLTGKAEMSGRCFGKRLTNVVPACAFFPMPGFAHPGRRC